MLLFCRSGIHRGGAEVAEGGDSSFAGRQQMKTIGPLQGHLLAEGRAVLGNHFLTIGQKAKSLCVLWVSVVNYYDERRY